VQQSHFFFTFSFNLVSHFGSGALTLFLDANHLSVLSIAPQPNAKHTLFSQPIITAYYQQGPGHPGRLDQPSLSIDREILWRN
jgi:hypothetical protein